MPDNDASLTLYTDSFKDSSFSVDLVKALALVLSFFFNNLTLPDFRELVSGSTLDFQETVDQTYGAFLIEKCGNKYAVLYHKMTYTTSATELPYYAESVNKIYIFSQSFAYESTIDCSSLVAGGGVRGIGWDGTNLKLLVHTPKVFDENQYGFADRFVSIDLSGAIISGSEVLLTTGQTAISSPVSNKHTLKQKICVNSLLNEIYMPKISVIFIYPLANTLFLVEVTLFTYILCFASKINE